MPPVFRPGTASWSCSWCSDPACAAWRSAVMARIQQINRALDCSPEPETEQLINDLLNGPNRTERSAL